MSEIVIKNHRYTVEPLYQWDTNQVLEIRGLSLSEAPEIHFTNDAMERSIVRYSTMDEAGVIRVVIPNSLLQKQYSITAYIGIREDNTYKSLYTIVVPIKARKMPTDYTIENDEEIYSFNELERLVTDAVTRVDAEFAVVTKRYEEVNLSYAEMLERVTQADRDLEEALVLSREAKENAETAATTYNDATEMINGFLGDYEEILAALTDKGNKAVVSASSLSVHGWNGKTYSFEEIFPVAIYDIEISLDSNGLTADQLQAFTAARIVGNATANVIKAFGDVPTVDIPIIMKVVRK